MRSHTERESQATCNNDNDCTYIYVNTRHTWVCWCDSSLSCSCQERVPLPPALEHPIFPGAFHRDACLVLQNFPPKWKYFKEAKPFRWHIRLRWLHLLSFFLTGKKTRLADPDLSVFLFFFWKIHSSNRVFQLDKKTWKDRSALLSLRNCICSSSRKWWISTLRSSCQPNETENELPPGNYCRYWWNRWSSWWNYLLKIVRSKLQLDLQ